MAKENGKVTVSREVAEILDQQRDNGLHESTIKYHAMEPEGWLEDAAPLNGLPLDTLIRALYIGYEVERTPEEEVAEYLRFLRRAIEDNYGDTRWTDELLGAQTILDKLGVKLPERTDAN